MTLSLEIEIEQLRAELNFCDPAERRQIEAELDLARAELALALAEQDGLVESNPPF